MLTPSPPLPNDPTPLMPSPTQPADSILLVNDRRDQLLSMAAMLEPLAVEVVSATSGKEALRHLLKREFSVMLLDVNMPGMDGFEMAEAVRSRPRSTLTPILFVSASHQGELDRLRGYESGAVDFVVVPVEPAILRAKVAAFLKMHRMHTEIRQQAEHLGRLNAQLSQSNVALKELQQSKDLLVGMVIHDLRNPLTACLGSLDLAIAQALKSGVAPSKYLGNASEATLHILEMVNGIVDIMRMEDGKMPINREDVDLDVLIDGRVERYRGAALTKGVALSHLPSVAAGRCSTDGALIGRVIDNLVVNAIKHTSDGGTIAITGQRTAQHCLAIAISDTGEGIPADAIGGLFQKYGRVAGQQLGCHYDTGLGLVFCRMAVELLGGSISVASERGHGTTFSVVIPEA